MDTFAQGESQLLLCTSIIESGLDVKRVNTIIVEDVHFFGLAQVYQVSKRD
jgi:transcription-repair coupling factor (superfamily II helicase)